MDAILIHGMGRTPLSMSILAMRLRASGIRPHLFGYSVTFERWDRCVQRFAAFIARRASTHDYIIIGHSLGTVLTRAALPRLHHPPAALFLLAPPARVCQAARFFLHHRPVKIFTGDMGQVLADQQFMECLPRPNVPARIYAGTGGPRGRYSPFGHQPNDGVLTVEETLIPGVPVRTVPVLHPFIMNSTVVAQGILQSVQALNRGSLKTD